MVKTIFRFLVHWGVDINAADSDGWTPLHCAASCNSVQMVKFLVENGAQIFAETYSDNETGKIESFTFFQLKMKFSAAEKCEELDEGYGMCSDYLYGTQVSIFTNLKVITFFVRKSLVVLTRVVFMLCSIMKLKTMTKYHFVKEIFFRFNEKMKTGMTIGGKRKYLT